MKVKVKPKRFAWDTKGRKQIKGMIEQFREDASEVFFYRNRIDSELIDFVALPSISLQWGIENPIWAQVIGAPGSGKTAHISLLEAWDKVVFVSRLSKNSFISGYRDEETGNDPSFLPKINGKLLVVKDFTCILQGPKEERDAVVGQLRDIFDGHASRVLGNIGHVEYRSRFNMLIAVTNIIDGFYGVSSQLGERFISRREYTQERGKITSAALSNIIEGRNDGKTKELKRKFSELIQLTPVLSLSEIEWPLAMKRRIVAGADLVAICRSHVIREKDGKGIASKSAPEVGTRLVTQIVQCIAGYCILHGLNEVNEDAWMFGGARILRDTLPTPIAWTLCQIYDLTRKRKIKNKSFSFTVKDLLPLTRLGWHTTEQIITDLYMNGAIEAEFVGNTGRRSTQFSMSTKLEETLRNLRLFDGYDDNEVELATLKERTKAKDQRRNNK